MAVTNFVTPTTAAKHYFLSNNNFKLCCPKKKRLYRSPCLEIVIIVFYLKIILSFVSICDISVKQKISVIKEMKQDKI